MVFKAVTRKLLRLMIFFANSQNVITIYEFDEV